MAICDDRPWPAFADPRDNPRLKAVLETAGFRDRTILETLRAESLSSLRQHPALLLRRTERGTPLDTFIRLFLMQIPVDIRALGRAVHPMSVESWVDAGLLDTRGDSARARVKLLPFKDLLIAFDPDHSIGTENYVMGIGSSSLTLANVTIRHDGVRTLDLGTGCGIQALLAARHSAKVTATDRNRRAVGMARFNALINGMDNVECGEANLFDALAGQKFDLIVSNPPFVVSPEARYTYRDSGMEEDDICRAIVRAAPRFLEEGGFCQMLCNWVECAGQDWRDRLASWFVGTGCDTWVMRSESQPIETYASHWIRHTERLDDATFGRRFDEWMAYYEKRGIESIAAGVINMRRVTGHRNWFRADEGPATMIGPCGEDIERRFLLQDYLEEHADDRTFLADRFRVSPDVRLEEQYAPANGAWSLTGSRFRLARGLVYSGEADAVTARFVGGCDGTKTLSDQVALVAVSLDADPESIRDTVAGIARRLVAQGFLVPHAIDVFRSVKE